MKRLLLSTVSVILVFSALTVLNPHTARADDPPNMQDYNTYWKVAADPAPSDPTLDYNTYSAEVQVKQQWQDRFGPPQ
jgi:hypothetical protein